MCYNPHNNFSDNDSIGSTDFSFNSYFSTDNNNRYDFIDVYKDNDFILYNNNFDLPFISQENKLFEKEINDNLFNTDLCNTNNILYYNNKSKKDSNKDTQIKFISKKEILDKNNINNIKLIYRKDAYYKHFKSIFARYIKDKANKLKNICFPHYNKNTFSALSYKYTGNPKEADNLKFLSLKVKDIIIMGKDIKIKNRQYNNELLIRYIEENKELTKDMEAYIDLINFLNNSVEEEIIIFYNDKLEYENLVNDLKCIFFDKHFKFETGFSLLDKNGFIQVLKKQN